MPFTPITLRGNELRRLVEAEILPHVDTPAQYTGGELNQVIKDHASVKIKVALGMPDTYAMGMSSLGLKVLYHCWNLRDDTVCEPHASLTSDTGRAGVCASKTFSSGGARPSLPCK